VHPKLAQIKKPNVREANKHMSWETVLEGFQDSLIPKIRSARQDTFANNNRCLVIWNIFYFPYIGKNHPN
jgi:hypothetical protein